MHSFPGRQPDGPIVAARPPQLLPTHAEHLRPTLPALLAVSAGCHALVTLQVFTLPALAPALAGAMHVSGSFIGAQILLLYLAAMLASLFAGSVVARLGPLSAAQVSIAGAAIALAAAAIPAVPVIAVAALVLGAAYGLVNPATAQMLEVASRSQRSSFVFSVKQAAVPVGGMLAGFIAPIITVAVGWQGALLAIAIASAAGAALAARTRRWFPFQRSPAAARGRMFGDLETVWRVPALRYACLSAASFAGVQLTLTTYLVTLLVDRAGVGLIAAGIGLSCFNVGGILGRFGWGLFADAIRSGSRAIATAFALAVVLLVVFAFGQAGWSIMAIYAFVAALGATVMGWNGVFVSEVMRLAPSGRTAGAIAGSFAVTYAGSLCGLGLFVVAFEALGGYGAGTWMICALALAGLGCACKAFVVARRDGAADRARSVDTAPQHHA